jgi:hypothetical protein
MVDNFFGAPPEGGAYFQNAPAGCLLFINNTVNSTVFNPGESLNKVLAIVDRISYEDKENKHFSKISTMTENILNYTNFKKISRELKKSAK